MVLSLLRRQRELLTSGRCNDLLSLNEELLTAIEEAAAASQSRARRQKAMQRGESASRRVSFQQTSAEDNRVGDRDDEGVVADDAWQQLRRTLRLVEKEAALNQNLAAETLAETEFTLDLLGMAGAYLPDGKRQRSTSYYVRAKKTEQEAGLQHLGTGGRGKQKNAGRGELSLGTRTRGGANLLDETA
jgi:hypothetical protein